MNVTLIYKHAEQEQKEKRVFTLVKNITQNCAAVKLGIFMLIKLLYLSVPSADNV